MDILLKTLLIFHICAGFTALGASLIAATIKIANYSHGWHVTTGKIFFWAMVVIFFTAVPISIITGNIFLLLIAVFSFYLALSGWCYARNRLGKPTPIDWFRSLVMLVGSLAMAAFGSYLISSGGDNGITMLVFAGIGGALSINDLRIILTGGVTGKVRIANHLTMMLAGTIATITAFLVVNITFNPVFVVWLAPTVVITPVIVLMNFRVLSKA